jgi:hypothetical protein
LSASVDEDVRRLDISVDDVMFILECLQPLRRGVCDLPENVLGDPITIELVDRATIHELDTDINRTFLEEGPVEVDDVR